ncbi:alpha/beta fold hydrolase [Sinosporangium siamense]|uniref:Peptidase n=1 Tax=Sinosporangium siamense TaxID=1367973 RepID=A0A919RAK1_9ACTN|nr:alpha/beta fold hydrolase [Sinosporangium siamense]GII90415.1 peptidase [Sinosporangium siamense]
MRSLTVGLALAVGLLPTPPAAARSGAEWKPCEGTEIPAGMHCAAVEVPVDWADPQGRKITLKLARLKATDPDRRIGSVLHIPGGPGGSGIDLLTSTANDLAELRQRFDLVGYDPRNTETLTPDSCRRPAVPQLAEPRNRREYHAQAAAFSAAFTKCRADDRSGLLGNLDSLSVARDMDAVRAALGEEKLSFMANSYGGVPAAAYMRLFPQRIRAMYLDGVIDQVSGWHSQTLLGFQAMEESFARFADWCGTTTACALHGEDVGKVWRALIRRADRDPLPVESPEFGKGKLTGSLLRWFSYSVDPGPGSERWRAFAAAVDKARRGDGSALATPVLGNSRVWSMPAMIGKTCGDDRGYSGYAQYREFRRQVRKVSPNFGGATFDALGCSGWPRPVANPSRPLPVHDLPPVLGLGTWGDYGITDSLVRLVPGSTTVRYDGPGHVMYAGGDPCAIAHATRYLTDLTLPPQGTVCHPPQ